jgi:signal transduction histidine kinase
VQVHQLETSRHQLQVTVGTPALVGVWDGERVERVLANLLSNATKYSPDGGVVRVVLARRTDVGGAWAVVRVEDHGVGIPAHDLPRVFERFHRGANVEGRIRGVGIGLAGAKQIVEQHGGTIALTSEEGLGTTVTVALPLEPDHATAARDEA